jgi:hypothetical protein
MKRVTFLVLVIACLVLASGVLAEPRASELPPPCVVEQESISGGGYQLASLTWKVSGSVGGGDYQLLDRALPSLRGSGCCCTYLPIGLRNAP